jgi:hypothetical protein
MTMVNNVIGMVNYVIAEPPSLLNFMIADRQDLSRVRRVKAEHARGLRFRDGVPAPRNASCTCHIRATHHGDSG